MALQPRSAGLSTAEDAPANLATGHTSACSATSNPTSAQHALLAVANLAIPDQSSPPHITYNLAKWKIALQHHPDQTLVSYHLAGLQHGYTHGNHSRTDLRTETTFPNLRSASLHQDVLTSNIQAELEARRYLGPFRTIEDIPARFRPFRNSPLGVVPKKHTQPPKFRTIQHLSYPEGASVNDGIDPDEFRIQYDSIQSLTSLLLKIGSSALFWKADVSEAFRTLPVHQSDWGMQGILWLDLYFLDMYVPFGLRSAPFIFTSLMDLFVWICSSQYELHNLSHYVDDFIYITSPVEAHHTYQIFQTVVTDFGVPLKPSKLMPPSPSIEYIGFQLDAAAMTIGIPAVKRARIAAVLASWLETSSPRNNPRPRSLPEAQSLLGCLMHVVQVIPEGKIFCDHLIRFTSGWKSSHTGRHHLSTGLRTDLSWWFELLRDWSGCRLISPSSWEDVGIYTDASGSLGAGGLFGERWWCVQWATPHQANLNGYDIFWKEMFAIWVSLCLWGPAFHGRHIIIHCDNQPCVESLTRGRAPHHPLVNDLIRRIVLLQLELGFYIRALYIESALNPADSVSRFDNLPIHPQDPLPTSVYSLFGFAIKSNMTSTDAHTLGQAN